MTRQVTPRQALMAPMVLGTLPGTPHAQSRGHPSRPIEVIVPAGAGGSTDVPVRATAPTCWRGPLPRRRASTRRNSPSRW